MTAVGILGTGRMGGSMARALAAAGFEVVCWNRTPEPATALAAELGGRSVATPAEVARAADVCVSMLADGPAVDAVYEGPHGLLAGARPGNVARRFVDRAAVHDPSVRGGKPGAPAPASSTRPCREASAWPGAARSRSWSAASRPTSSARARS